MAFTKAELNEIKQNGVAYLEEKLEARCSSFTEIVYYLGKSLDDLQIQMNWTNTKMTKSIKNNQLENLSFEELKEVADFLGIRPIFLLLKYKVSYNKTKLPQIDTIDSNWHRA